MKRQLVTVLLIFSIAMNAQNTTGLVGEKISFIADDNSLYKFSAQIDAPLLWQESGSQVVTVNISVDSTPDLASAILFEYITFEILDLSNNVQPESEFLSVQEEISNNVTQSYQKFIRSPTLVDTFKLNVTIAAITRGNDSSQDPNNPRQYNILFGEKLSVQRSQAQALIDLYGFPPTSYFQKWMIIVLPLSGIILLPSFVAGLVKLKELYKHRKQQKQEVKKA